MSNQSNGRGISLSAFSIEKFKKMKLCELMFIRLNEISEIFSMMDKHDRKFITLEECLLAIRVLGFMNESYDIENRLIVKGYSQTENKIPFVMFKSLATDLIIDQDYIEELMKHYRLLDYDKKGSVTYTNIKEAAKLTGQQLSYKELHIMLDEFDRDGDGSINLEEFMALMTG